VHFLTTLDVRRPLIKSLICKVFVREIAQKCDEIYEILVNFRLVDARRKSKIFLEAKSYAGP
jgi:hypothetical protein